MDTHVSTVVKIDPSLRRAYFDFEQFNVVALSCRRALIAAKQPGALSVEKALSSDARFCRRPHEYQNSAGRICSAAYRTTH